MGKGCADCGYKQHPAALDFDHVKGKKSFELSSSHSRSIEAVFDEIAKCEVVCANCHRIRTYNRRHGVKQTRQVKKKRVKQER